MKSVEDVRLKNKVLVLKSKIDYIWNNSEPMNQCSDKIFKLLKDDYGQYFGIYGIVSFNTYLGNIKDDIEYQTHRLSDDELKDQTWQAVKDDTEKIQINSECLRNTIQQGTPLINIMTGDFLSEDEIMALIDSMDASERDALNGKKL